MLFLPFMCLGMLVLGGKDVPPPPVATSRPASAPATQRAPFTAIASPDEIAGWVSRLGSAKFKEREAAFQALSAMGEAATPLLVPHISDHDPEVAARVASLIRPPHDPDLRVELATRLVLTLNPEWMERGVHMMFEDAEACADRFAERAGRETSKAKVVLAPIAAHFKEWRSQRDRLEEIYRRKLSENPEVAAKIRAKWDEQAPQSARYQAEAAYWEAIDAMLEMQGKEPRAPGPTTTRASP